MKILQIIPNFDMGGAETMCEGLCGQLRELGNEVVAVSLYDCDTPITKRLTASGIRLVTLGKHRGPDLGCMFRLRKLLVQEQPDVLHTHLHALKYTAAAAKNMGIPIIHTVHNVADKEAGPDKKRNGKLYKKGIAVPVSLSTEVQKSVMALYGLSRKATPVILNGIDLSHCIPKQDFRLHSPAQIIHVGRFYEQKNHTCMVEAMAMLKQAGVNATLKFVGDGPLLTDIKKLVKSKGLEDVILFNGVSDRVFDLLHKADLFILPSKWEGLPMTVIEAMGTGIPVIASDVGGLSDMIITDHSGILIQPEAKELAEAIQKLLASEALRSHLGINARMEVTRFSAQTMAFKYQELYQEQLRRWKEANPE